MPLLSPPLTKEDFINSGWQNVVKSSEKKVCLTYSSAFFQKAQQAREAGNAREQAVFRILAYLTSVDIKPEATDSFFADRFNELTDEYLDFLAEIVTDVSDPELQARIANILWSSRRRNYQMAQLAVTAYLKSATELEDPKSWGHCFRRISRACELAHTIHNQVEQVFAHIEAVLDRYNGEAPLWLSTKLMGLLQEYRHGDPTKYSSLAERAATLAEEAHHWDRAQALWNIKAIWHRIEQDSVKEREASMLAAEIYVKQAEDALKNSPFPYATASDHLQRAVEAFRNIRGTKEETVDAKARAEEIHKRLIQYQKESLKESIPISQQYNISNHVKQAKEFVSGKELRDALFALALLGASSPIASLRQDVQKTLLLSRYMPRVKMNEMGKVVARQPSNSEQEDEAIRFEMYNTAVSYQRLHAQAYIEPAIYQINLEHSVQINDLLPIVSHSPFVPPNREHLFTKGLYAGLTGDFFAATHILIPQIENSVRYLLERQGMRTSSLDKGIQNEYFLTSTLYPKNYPIITSIFDEDTLFDLQGLLVEHSGSNLRNRMAHGLINDDEFSSPIMTYLWWLTLRLCCLPILKYQQRVEQSDPWVKFDGMFKDDPLFDEFVEDMATYRRELDAEVADREVSSAENLSA